MFSCVDNSVDNVMLHCSSWCFTGIIVMGSLVIFCGEMESSFWGTSTANFQYVRYEMCQTILADGPTKTVVNSLVVLWDQHYTGESRGWMNGWMDGWHCAIDECYGSLLLKIFGRKCDLARLETSHFSSACFAWDKLFMEFMVLVPIDYCRWTNFQCSIVPFQYHQL
jgi:hypothetical protein